MTTAQTSQSMHHHKTLAAAQGAIPVAVVTVSDNRTAATDTNKHYLEAALAAAGHRLVAYRLIKDEPDQVVAVLDELATGEARIILFTGGTGISRRDTTIDVLTVKLEKHLVGFGELFRMRATNRSVPLRCSRGRPRARTGGKSSSPPLALRLRFSWPGKSSSRRNCNISRGKSHVNGGANDEA